MAVDDDSEAKKQAHTAPPFHPKDFPPKAPCPKCVKDKGDDTPKDLYGIRGLGDGEYDPMIPAEWRRCPAIKLDSSVPGMSAVRVSTSAIRCAPLLTFLKFQYMALCQYARQARKHWKGLASKLSKAETACSEERRQRRELHAQVQQLKKQNETVQDLGSRLKKWEARKPVINRNTLHIFASGITLTYNSHRLSGSRQSYGRVSPRSEVAYRCLTFE